MPLSALDPNFRAPALGHEARWHDAASVARLTGRGWEDAAPYARLPDRARALVRDEVWQLSRHAAGLALEITTDSPLLAVRWRVTGAEVAMDHMPATGVSGIDCYERDARGWRWRATARNPTSPWSQALLFAADEGRPRALRVHLPLYNGVEAVELGVAPGASIGPTPPDGGRPICFYGTSITQGGCASRPGMAYPAILSRRLGRPAINLGFSGNGRMEPEIATLLAELDPVAFVLDALPNVEEPLVTERLEPLVRMLRAARPATPIVLVGNVAYGDSELVAAKARRCADSNAAMARACARLAAAGIGGLTVVPGERLLAGDGEDTVDGVHPTDLGFARIADALEAPLRQALRDISG
ncbi:MAG TPA: SGNH/GDSL hydrolase family protein [Planctomycetota bacterium]|nr:SGNH/GDSL hydrolase family protein [Planctomycetota bacterium]